MSPDPVLMETVTHTQHHMWYRCYQTKLAAAAPPVRLGDPCSSTPPMPTPADELAQLLALHTDCTRARQLTPALVLAEAGVGKTQAAKALASMLGTPLIRLQCFEGIDAAEALYEWNYQRQLLAIRAASASDAPSEEIEERLFTERYLLRLGMGEAELDAEQVGGRGGW